MKDKQVQTVDSNADYDQATQEILDQADKLEALLTHPEKIKAITAPITDQWNVGCWGAFCFRQWKQTSARAAALARLSQVQASLEAFVDKAKHPETVRTSKDSPSQQAGGHKGTGSLGGEANPHKK